MTDMVNGSQNFTYDEQDRLLSANGPYGATNYAYDPIGNMTCNSALSGCASSTPNYSYGNPAHVHAVTNGAGTLYAYDNNGNMTGRGSNRLTYDAENRLIYVTSSTGTSTMIYDGDGGRVEKITPAGTTIYIGKLYECTGTNCIKYIFSGGSRIATKTVTGNSIYYYHTDHLGSSSVMTDASGKNAETMKYAPYGLGYYDSYINGNGAIYTPYKYTGQYFDSDTSLYFYNARYYDPALGRFISADSVIGRPSDPQSLNRYSYVGNNPIIYTDPSGHCDIFRCPGQTVSNEANRFANSMSIGSQAGQEIGAGAIIVATAIATWECGGCGAWEEGALFGATLGEAAGGYSAYRGKGNILKGVFVGGIIGGLAGAAGGLASAGVGGVAEGGAVVGGLAGGAVEGGGYALVNGGNLEAVLVGAMVGGMEGEATGTMSMAMNDLYYGTTGYGIDMGPGGDATVKPPGGPAAYKGQNNVGVANPNKIQLANPCWYCEGSPSSKFLNQIPSINAIAGFHDFINPSGPALALTFIPTIPVSAAVTYGGYMVNFPYAPLILDQTK